MWVGCCDTGGYAQRVVVSRGYAYVAAIAAGLQVIAVTNPAAPVLVATIPTGGHAMGVVVCDNRIYVADLEKGLKVFCTLPQLQYMMRVDGTSGTPFTIEAALGLSQSVLWTPVFTTNPPAGSFEFTDFDVAGPQKFYRARQP